MPDQLPKGLQPPSEASWLGTVPLSTPPATHLEMKVERLTCELKMEEQKEEEMDGSHRAVKPSLLVQDLKALILQVFFFSFSWVHLCVPMLFLHLSHELLPSLSFAGFSATFFFFIYSRPRLCTSKAFKDSMWAHSLTHLP